MVRVEYGLAPVEDGNKPWWFPDYLKDPNIEIVHSARWRRAEPPNGHLATFVVFISEEDANYLLLKYPDHEKDFHKI